MKLMLCEECMSLVVPSPRDGEGRSCECSMAVVWWDNGAAGKLAVYSHAGKDRVSVIGLHNGLLREQYARYAPDNPDSARRKVITGEQIARILDETPDSYVFKQVRSPAIKVQPGYTNDIRFATLREMYDALDAGRPPHLRVGGGPAPKSDPEPKPPTESVTETPGA